MVQHNTMYPCIPNTHTHSHSERGTLNINFTPFSPFVCVCLCVCVFVWMSRLCCRFKRQIPSPRLPLPFHSLHDVIMASPAAWTNDNMSWLTHVFITSLSLPPSLSLSLSLS